MEQKLWCCWYSIVRVSMTFDQIHAINKTWRVIRTRIMCSQERCETPSSTYMFVPDRVATRGGCVTSTRLGLDSEKASTSLHGQKRLTFPKDDPCFSFLSVFCHSGTLSLSFSSPFSQILLCISFTSRGSSSEIRSCLEQLESERHNHPHPSTTTTRRRLAGLCFFLSDSFNSSCAVSCKCARRIPFPFVWRWILF